MPAYGYRGGAKVWSAVRNLTVEPFAGARPSKGFNSLERPKTAIGMPIWIDMSTSSINNLSSSYLQSILGTALQNAGVTAGQTNSINTSLSALQSDQGQLSPFVQVMSTLQQLQQSNPSQYQQVTQQIATNLQSAAQTAQSQGNTAAANQLNQLASDFTSASQNGQLPNVQDLAKALSGHHHHGGGHHHHASSDSDSSTSSTDASSSSSPLSQLLSAFQTDQNQALNPLSIIENTLSSAGITGSNG